MHTWNGAVCILLHSYDYSYELGKKKLIKTYDDLIKYR